MAKYLGWRGVQGNFRGKVERVQRRNVAKYQGWRGVQRAISEERWKEWSAAQKQQKRLAGCSSNYRSQKKNKEKVERYPERRSSQTLESSSDDDLSS